MMLLNNKQTQLHNSRFSHGKKHTQPAHLLHTKTHTDRPTTTALDVKISVSVGDGEPIESALRRFKREVNESGHLMDLKHKRFFETTQEKVKRKIKEGRLRRKFERMNRKRMSNRV